MFYRIIVSDGSCQKVAVLGNQAADTYKKAGKPKNCLINIESAFIHENSISLRNPLFEYNSHYNRWNEYKKFNKFFF